MQGSIICKFRLFLFLLISSIIIISCGGGGSNNLPKTDSIAPTVTVTPEIPPAGQTIPVTTQITAKFSKSMNAKSVMDGIIVVPNNNGTIIYDDSTKTATYKPDPNIGKDLQGNTKYTVTLQNSIKDSANNSLKEITWSFRTEDNVKPKIISTIPNSGSPPISINDVIRIEFSEPMNTDTFKQMFDSTTRNFVITTGTTIITNSEVDKTIFSGTLNETGSFVDYTPVKPFLSNTTYIVMINTGVTDKNSNPLDKLTSYTFKTSIYKDTFAPIFKILTPVNNSKNNSPSSVIKVEFKNSDGSKEAMNWSTITSNNFIVENELGNQVFGSFQHDPTTNILTFTPGTNNNPAIPKNLNLLDSYKITLLDTIQDIAKHPLVTKNTVASTFHTSDGTLHKSATQLGQGYLGVGWERNDVLLSTETNGNVLAIWERKDTNTKTKTIWTNAYKSGTWSSTSSDITTSIVTTSVSNLAHSLYYLIGLVTDKNDDHLLIWRDKVDNFNVPAEKTSIFASKWAIINSAKKWHAPKFVHQGSLSKSIDNSSNKPFINRSKNGTVTVVWTEMDASGTPTNPVPTGWLLTMKQLKSNNGFFATTWSTSVRVTNTPIAGKITENSGAIGTDSAGNTFILYDSTNDDPNNPNAWVGRLNLAKYPFPSNNLTKLSGHSYNLSADSSNNYIAFGWSINGVSYVNAYNTASLTIDPSLSRYVASPRSYQDGYSVPVGAVMLPNNEVLAATVLSSGAIQYEEYNPTKGWTTSSTYNGTFDTTSFKLFHGPRNIVTIVWATTDNKIHVRRYKPGADFGWQAIQSFNGKNAKNINITAGVDGHTTIIWQEPIINTASQTYLFAIRLE